MSDTSPSKKITVAVADDHAVFRQGVISLLSLEDDLEVVATLNNGVEVLKMFETLQPDVLLLDLRMPELGGLEALEKLAGKDLRTKIIVLTASEDQIEYVQAISDGASGVVLKTAATERLPACIRAVNEGELWLDGGALPLPDEPTSGAIPI